MTEPELDLSKCTTLLAAWNKAMSEMGTIEKTGKNEYNNYNYASEFDLIQGIRPHLVSNGLLLMKTDERPKPVDKDGNLYLECTWRLLHISGEVWPLPITIHSCARDIASKQNQDKALYKAQTGNRKSLLRDLFLLSIGEEAKEADKPGDPERDKETAKKKTAAAQKRRAEKAKSRPVATNKAFNALHDVVTSKDLDRKKVADKIEADTGKDIERVSAKDLLGFVESIKKTPDDWADTRNIKEPTPSPSGDGETLPGVDPEETKE